jgi:hypothetical protein
MRRADTDITDLPKSGRISTLLVIIVHSSLLYIGTLAASNKYHLGLLSTDLN